MSRERPSRRAIAVAVFMLLLYVVESIAIVWLNDTQSFSRSSSSSTIEPRPEQDPYDEHIADVRKSRKPASEINSIGMKLVLVPAGEFLMGSAESAVELARAFDRKVTEVPWLSYEQPQHRVRITQSFYIGAYEVTQEQYDRIMGTNPSFVETSQCPVDGVVWDDAIEFCRKLSALPEERAAGRVYRLPTEAEWEYACGAGSTNRYSFGDDPAGLTYYAWYKGNAGSMTHPVGQKCPNAWGLFDMHGNVWEWCADWYDDRYYANSPLDDPPGPTAGRDRVVRGGSCSSARALCGTKNRFGGRPRNLSYDRGFRVVATCPAGQANPAASECGTETDGVHNSALKTDD